MTSLLAVPTYVAGASKHVGLSRIVSAPPGVVARDIASMKYVVPATVLKLTFEVLALPSLLLQPTGESLPGEPFQTARTVS
jgi:hypothetical protein